MITAVAGWVVARLVLLAIRHPKRFRGVGRLGWQASVARHEHDFAAAAAGLVATRGLSSPDLGGRAGCDGLAEHYSHSLSTQALAVARGCTEALGNGRWDSLPAASKATIVERVRANGEQALTAALSRFDEEAGDVRSLAEAAFSRDGHTLLEKFLKEAGAEELRFIELCGTITGVYAGVIEVILWGLYPSAWLPVLVATTVGCGVSWLTLRMLLRPHRSTRYFWAVTYQGLLPKRRKELISALAASIAHEAATDRYLIGMLTAGPGALDLARAILDAINPQASPSDETLERVREALADQLVRPVARFTVDLEAYHEFEQRIASLVSRRLGRLRTREIEPLLANILAADTRVLIASGGALGTLIGLLQATLLGLA